MKILFAPHNDDETLFGAFTILREQPLVVVVYDSYAQNRRGCNVTAEGRRQETLAAMKVLGAEVEFCGLSDESMDPVECVAALRRYIGAGEVWAPACEDNGHPHHNIVANAVASLFTHRHHYMTYTTSGKSVGIPVAIQADWTLKKLRALACYESQIELASTRRFFLGDQYEYYLGARSGAGALGRQVRKVARRLRQRAVSLRGENG
jgi:LmbE family N-acetylglucosaminyl deacetylase